MKSKFEGVLVMDGFNYNNVPIRKYTDIGYFNEARQNQKYVEAEKARKAQQENVKNQKNDEKSM